MSAVYVDLIKDKSDTKTLATLSNSAVSLHSDVVIPDSSSPHGWEHIKTISYNAETSTPQNMSSVVSSKYSAYKLYIQWGVHSGSQDLFFRFLDSSDSSLSTSSYSYGCQIVSETAVEGAHFQSTGASSAQIANDSIQGSRGFNGEITLFNCYASASDYPQIDGYQLDNSRSSPAFPHAFFHYTGHDGGSYDLGGNGFFWYAIDPQYVSGFQLLWGGSGQVDKGSFWSCYGLKLPTAD